jgi:hypothetical protein
MLCSSSKMPAPGVARAEAAAVAGACDAWFCGGGVRKRRRGLQLRGMPPCQGRGLRWTSGGGRDGRLVKVLLKVPRILQQPTQIDHRVSVGFPDYGERLNFLGVDGVWCRRSGHRLAVRVGFDAAHDTDTPAC